jgi:pimeloyl-ACP methyl ester carboxylesterase
VSVLTFRNKAEGFNVTYSVSRRNGLWIIIAVAVLVLYGIVCSIGGMMLAEMQLHPWRMPIRHESAIAETARKYYQAELQSVSVTTDDNFTLRAWYVVPEKDNGSAVILLHGVGDNREGVAGYARLFLDHGYRVLLPDARAHGTSGGELATYGLREAGDIKRWVDWLQAGRPNCVYGFGESMGAALVLQSLRGESRFCAVVVESPFSRFRQVAYERSASYTRMPFWIGRTLEVPVVEFALFYAREKYGIDFTQANPKDAVATTRTPVLLIGDEKDIDILPYHAVELHEANPTVTELWIVKGAAHGGAWGANPTEFNRRVLAFFKDHAGTKTKATTDYADWTDPRR